MNEQIDGEALDDLNIRAALAGMFHTIETVRNVEALLRTAGWARSLAHMFLEVETAALRRADAVTKE